MNAKYIVLHTERSGRIGSMPLTAAALFNVVRVLRMAGYRLHIMQRDISGTVHFNVMRYGS